MVEVESHDVESGEWIAQNRYGRSRRDIRQKGTQKEKNSDEIKRRKEKNKDRMAWTDSKD